MDKRPRDDRAPGGTGGSALPLAAHRAMLEPVMEEDGGTGGGDVGGGVAGNGEAPDPATAG